MKRKMLKVYLKNDSIIETEIAEYYNMINIESDFNDKDDTIRFNEYIIPKKNILYLEIRDVEVIK